MAVFSSYKTDKIRIKRQLNNCKVVTNGSEVLSGVVLAFFVNVSLVTR